jgi:dihydroorotase
MEGLALAELYDMQMAGAIAFGDYKKNIDNANLLKIALQYTGDFNGLLLAHSQDNNLTGNGVAHEGATAVQLGLRGIPALAEEIMVARNLYLLEYTGGKLHIPCISTAGSIRLIKEAKQKGLNVSCSVAVHHLFLTDEELTNFDTRFKINPPLRDNETRKILLEAVLDDTIDMITSDHRAVDIEHKKVAFDLALDGTIGLESALGTLLQILPLDVVIKKLVAGRKRFGVESAHLAIGKQANITLFNPSTSSRFTQDKMVSKSKNAAMEGFSMKGSVYGIITKNQLIIN